MVKNFLLISNLNLWGFFFPFHSQHESFWLKPSWCLLIQLLWIEDNCSASYLQEPLPLKTTIPSFLEAATPNPLGLRAFQKLFVFWRCFAFVLLHNAPDYNLSECLDTLSVSFHKQFPNIWGFWFVWFTSSPVKVSPGKENIRGGEIGINLPALTREAEPEQ